MAGQGGSRGVLGNRALIKQQQSSPVLLEEELPPHPDPATPRVSTPRHNEVAAVLDGLTFAPPQDLENRLRTVVQLRLKDVRSEDETRAILARPLDDGGFNLGQKQIDEIIERCDKVMMPDAAAAASSRVERHGPQTNIEKKSHVTPLKQIKKLPSPPPMHPPGSFLPQKIGEEHVAVATPNNAFVHDRKSEVRSQISDFGHRTSANPDRGSDIRHPTSDINRPSALAQPEEFKLNSSKSSAKAIMHDVVAKPAEFGPIEEIRYVTLTDFRRLSHNPVEAAARLKQKFVNLYSESILLYLDAWDAWRQSPLFGQYIQYINNHLTAGTALKGAQGAQEVQPAEINAIVQMEKELSVV